MEIFKRILLNALIAGFILGLPLTLVQSLTVYPLILEAELHEEDFRNQNPISFEEVESDSDESEWFPENGFERIFYSWVSNLFLTIAYAIFINIGFTLYSVKHWEQGILWGVAGVAVFYVIPTLVYDPVLPGTIEADHFARQLWWLATVECSAFGLAILVFSSRYFIRFSGLFLIVMAMLIGAPPGEFFAISPGHLVNTFIQYNLVINIIYWALLGALSAFLFLKFTFSGHRAIESV